MTGKSCSRPGTRLLLFASGSLWTQVLSSKGFSGPSRVSKVRYPPLRAVRGNRSQVVRERQESTLSGITVTLYQTPYGCPLQTPGSVDSPRGREGGEVGSSDSEADGTANWERQHPEDTEIATSTAAPPGNRLAARDIGRLIEPGLASPTFFAIVPPTILEFRR
jgi:hypothetical protein